ncbi:hypothetical protein HB364_14030 [Pseudoflavitalea sp. X16]|uniref:hypothetical protein n=1 Tax=Paraflavitalea devenefica TaxID=2716334 RepID=UPI00141FBD99|nr:hypothetical protein [Paraflavitalea devenefica]NII26208.1 hypothetical protein [Paraflavitalea devenefica]
MQLYERSYPFLRLMYDNLATAPVNHYMAAPDDHAMAFTIQNQSFQDLLAYFPASK